MLLHLIRKELLDHLLSLRFAILAALGALIIGLSLYSGYDYHRQRMEDYRLAQTGSQERLRQIETSDQIEEGGSLLEITAITYLINRPPSPMAILARGLSEDTGRSKPVRGFSSRTKFSAKAADPILGMFPSLDMGLVVEIVLSLLVLLLTYDAVCGEKEAGTLRLVDSSAVSRVTLLVAKILGVMLPVFAAFGLPLFFGVGILLLLPDAGLGSQHLGQLGWLVFVWAVYLTTVATAGVLASALVTSPASSFVILLALWTAATSVIPRVSLIVSDTFRPAPSAHRLQTEIKLVNQEQSNLAHELRAEWEQNYLDRNGEPWYESMEGREARQTYYHEAWREAGRDYGNEAISNLTRDFENQNRSRMDLATAIASLSPSFSLRRCTQRLADTGIAAHDRFEASTREHNELDNEWFLRFVSLQRLQYTNPEKYGEFRWDVSDMPRFTYSRLTHNQDVVSTLYDVGSMALWGVLLFAASVVAVIRYDVR